MIYLCLVIARNPELAEGDEAIPLLSLRGTLSLPKGTKQSLLVIARNPELVEGDEAIPSCHCEEP
jgi:hypothetical protein